MIDYIGEAIAQELERANQKFPLFASAHEGWAVILEEVEEAAAEMAAIRENLTALWLDVKCDDAEGYLARVKELKLAVVGAIEELVQVAAMSEKFEQSLGTGINVGTKKPDCYEKHEKSGFCRYKAAIMDDDPIDTCRECKWCGYKKERE